MPGDSLYLLLFTSGTTSAPKAVRCTQGRLADIAAAASVGFYGFTGRRRLLLPDAALPRERRHGSVGPGPGLGRLRGPHPEIQTPPGSPTTCVGSAPPASPMWGRPWPTSSPCPSGPTTATPPCGSGSGPKPRPATGPSSSGGSAARLVEGYGSSEGGLAINRTPDTPAGALGRPTDDVAAVDPDTGVERPRARIGPDGRLENPEESIGELVNRSGAGRFEGYWRHPDATAQRVRQGWYWTGDLGYVDTDGFVWFAGRSDDWLRVDSENFSAAPVERILERHPDVLVAAVYAVPDPRTGDQVMAAVELRPGADVAGLAHGLPAFLATQRDLGTKWAPRFVRVTGALPPRGHGQDHQAGAAAPGLGLHRSRRLATRPGRSRLPPVHPGRRRRPGHGVHRARPVVADPGLNRDPGSLSPRWAR